ncbi:hypothetical protein BH23ACT6_BH23ACT6_26690 [soil metagenome]
MTELRTAVADYLAVRRALGFKLIEAERLLHQFLDYLDEHEATTITIETALAWATAPEKATAWWRRKRLGIVRAFARYLTALGVPVEVPPVGLIPTTAPRATPYLYSEADLASLMHAAGELRLPLRQATYQTLIGVLAVTGMRIGEAIALDVDDVDLTTDLLTIRNTKFGKSRELVLHPTTTAALGAYHHKVLVPDNMKSIVDRADPTAPRLNVTFTEYAQARGFVIDPARVRSPQDKGLASYCTSWCGWGTFCCRGSLGEAAALLLAGRVRAWGRVEPLLLVVGLVAVEEAGGLPALDGGGVHAELFGELVAGEHPGGAEPFVPARQAVGAA